MLFSITLNLHVHVRLLDLAVCFSHEQSLSCKFCIEQWLETIFSFDRCLEEGAEEFLLKPVKLSDVKRLKDYIMRGETEENEGRRVHKRRIEDDTQPPSSSSSTASSPSSPLPSPSLTATPFACDLATSELLLSPLHSSKRAKLHNSV